MNDWNARLTQIKKQYASKLVTQLRDLQGIVTNLIAHPEPDPTEPIQMILQQAHRLHGTAGSYGFVEVSRNLRTVEEFIRHHQQAHKNTPTSSLWSAVQFQSLLEPIEQALQDPDLYTQLPTSDSLPTAVPNHSIVHHVSNARWFQTRLLVVDDDIDVLQELEYFAQKTLNHVFCSQTAEEALAIAQREELDAALIDIHLVQNQNGFTLAEKLQQLPGKETLPIVFFSANPQFTNRIEAARHNATFFFSKPLGINDFQFIINQIVSRKQEQPARILVLDQDVSFLHQVETYLTTKSMQVSLLTDPNQVLEAMDIIKPDVLLMDIVQPGVSGFDLCRMLRAIPAWQHLPILFVTEQKDMETRLNCYRAGADDYLCKPLVFEELYTRIEMRLTRAQLLKAYADHDPLTGLLNRRAMILALQRKLAEARRHQHGISLALLDIDHFKQINDHHGHLVGDHVLASLGRMMSRRFRVEDLKSRWGGEEFCLAFSYADPASTQEILQRFLETFRALPFLNEAGETFYVQFSAGIAHFPQDGNNIEQLLRQADRFLYQAKSQGRNQIVLSPTEQGHLS